MKISNIQVNHMNKPMGFNLSSLRIDFKIEDTNETNLKKQLIISSNDQVVYDSNLITYNNNYFTWVQCRHLRHGMVCLMRFLNG